MGNIRYPAGLRGKASLAWLGGLFCGFSPILYFYINYYIREHYTGNPGRPTYGEPPVYHAWQFLPFHHMRMSEALHAHPQKDLSSVDKKRLRINELNDLTRV